MSVYCRKGPKLKVLGKIWKNHRNSISPEDSGSQKEGCRGATGWPDLGQARPPWQPRVGVVSSTPTPSRVASSPIRALRPKKLRDDHHPSTKSSVAPPPAETRVRGTEVSVPAPCRTGKCPRSHRHHLHRLHFDSMMVCE